MNFNYRVNLYFRVLLRLIFGFDKWHIAPLESKMYLFNTISFLNNKLVKRSVVEIGCGLGDLIRHLNYEKIYGYDNSRAVLRAAEYISFFQKNIFFRLYSFPHDNLVGLFDVIILVNWIHHIEPKVLKLNIENYFTSNLEYDGYIILDTVKDPVYKYNHEIPFICKDLQCEITSLGSFDRGREMWAIKKILI